MDGGIFPRDEQLGLNPTVYSHEMAKPRGWFSAWLPYAQCEQVFARIGERLVPASSRWRQTHQHRDRLARQVAQQRDQVSLDLVKLPDAIHDHDQGKGVTLAGGRVKIRDEGWRELKVGAIFAIAPQLDRDPTHRRSCWWNTPRPPRRTTQPSWEATRSWPKPCGA